VAAEAELVGGGQCLQGMAFRQLASEHKPAQHREQLGIDQFRGLPVVARQPLSGRASHQQGLVLAASEPSRKDASKVAATSRGSNPPWLSS